LFGSKIEGRFHMGLIVGIVSGVALATAVYRRISTRTASPTHELLSSANLSKWTLTRGYEKRPAWVWKEGGYTGDNSCIAYPQHFSNFILECEFLFQGKGEGGIQLRGDAHAFGSWEVGYQLDVDWAKGRKHGHIHFPVKPTLYCAEALFTVGVWHTVRVAADGPRIVVSLDGKQVLQFEDEEYSSGQICLQGETDGVLYRNVKVTETK
jgi:hypothetical protein